MAIKPTKADRMVTKSLLGTQVETTSEAFKVPTPPVTKPIIEKKAQGRPAVKPPCRKITIELPIDLLDKLQIAANDKTAGNRTVLIERILKGETTLNK